MKLFKVIITLLLVFSMAFCIIVPVGASDYTSQISTLWEQWMHNVNSAYPFLGDLPGLLCSEVCTNSTDGLHHCTSLDNATLANTGHDDKGWYCNCVCAYCGKTFKAYSSDFEHAYNTYVTALPAAGFGRDSTTALDSGYIYYFPTADTFWSNYDSYSFTNNVVSANSFSVTASVSGGGHCRATYKNFTVPVTGIYDRVVYITSATNIAGWGINNWSGGISGAVRSSNYTRTKGDTYYADYVGFQPSNITMPCSISGYLVLRVTVSASLFSYYPTSSRVNTVINNYAVKNEDNTYNYITNKPIFDEDTLVFFNPLTGVSFNVTGWYYDYSTRRYVLTYKDDKDVTQTTTVEYGDENIKVTTGDTTNNYYYTVPDTSCQHTYVISNSLASTCTAPGSKTYTCSKCNDTYSETVPALGHNWVKGETVPTTYEVDGTTVKTRGYTLYTCSRCGEKYYDYDGTGPPASSEEDTPTLNWLQRIYYKLVDILNAVLGIDTSVTVDTVSGTDIKVTVPGVDGTEDKQFSLKDFKAKFGWLHEIHTIISTFVSDITSDSQNAYAMSATSFAAADDGSQAGAAAVESPTGSTSAAPSIVIDFSKAQSVYGYNYGGQTEVLDLSWYAEYKPTVDAILSGFLWLLFLWGVFKHAPGIIGGGDLMDNQIDKFKGGRKS